MRLILLMAAAVITGPAFASAKDDSLVLYQALLDGADALEQAMTAGGGAAAVADRIDEQLHKPMNAATKDWMAAALKFPAETTPYAEFLVCWESAQQMQQYGYEIQRHLRGLERGPISTENADNSLAKLEACQLALGIRDTATRPAVTISQ